MGIVTSVIWIFLFAAIALSAYSIVKLEPTISSPTVTVMPNHDLVFSMPLKFRNMGYTELKGFNITTQICDAEGCEITKSSSYVAILPMGENIIILHNVTLNGDQLMAEELQYLFEDTNFTLSIFGGLNIAGMLPATLSTNVTYPWGAPLYNFSLGTPDISLPSLQNAKISFPLSFVNHASFPLEGNLSLNVYDSANKLQGYSQVNMNVPPSAPFNGALDFYVPLSLDSLALTSGHVEFSFTSSSFSFGPWRLPYG
jgi:hypothetical protein